MRRLWLARPWLALRVALVLVVAMSGIALGQRTSVADDRSFHQLRKIVTEIAGEMGVNQRLTLQVEVELDPTAPGPPPEWFAAVEEAFKGRLANYRVRDLKGSAGMYRLRDDLLGIAHATEPNIKVLDILFREMTVQ